MPSWQPDKVAQNAGNPAPGFKLDGMVMEPKYDGFRLLAEVTESGVNLYTRTGSAKSGHAPHITAALSHLPAGTWLDGEVCVFDEDGLQTWGSVQSIFGGNPKTRGYEVATFMVFDLMAYGGLDIRPLPMAERRLALETALTESDCVQLTPQRPASQEAHDAMVADGWEGSIVKDPTKPYASGKRGRGWTKLKATDELDVVIMGLEPGRDLGAFVFGQYKNGVLTQRGKCKVYASCKHLGNGDVISVAHNGIMPSESMRHAMFKRHRTDKPAKDCIWT